MMPVAAILTALEAFGSWCFKHWKLIGSAIVVSSLLFMVHVRTVQRDSARGQYTSEKQAHDLDKANWKAATAEAQKQDIAHARDVEQQQAKAAQETQDALQAQLATLRANLAGYAQRVRSTSGAYQSGGGTTSMPGIPNPASGLAENGSGALVPVPLGDLDTCAVNTAAAIGWQNWYRQVSAIKR